MRRILAYRGVFNLALAAVAGTLGVRAYPFPRHNVFLAVLEARKKRLRAFRRRWSIAHPKTSFDT